MKGWIAMLVTIVLVGLLSVIPNFINWNTLYGNRVASQIEAIFKNQVVARVGGKITISLIPAKMTIKNLYIEPKDTGLEHNRESAIEIEKSAILIEKAELKPKISSLFSSKPILNQISLHRMTGSSHDLLAIEDMNQASTESLYIYDSKISTGDKKSNKLIDIVHAKLRLDAHESGSVIALVKMGDNEYNLSYETIMRDGVEEATLKITSPHTQVSFKGKKDAKSTLKGILSANGDNLSSLFNDLSMMIGNHVFTAISAKESFEFTSDVVYSKNALEMKKINFVAKSVQFSGGIKWQDKDLSEIKIRFANLDLDALEDDDEKTLYDALDYITLISQHHLKSSAEIIIDHMKYRNKEAKNFILSAKGNNDLIHLDHLSMLLPGKNNILNIAGVVTNNGVRAKFEGSMSIEGEDCDELMEWFFPLSLIPEKRKERNKVDLRANLYIVPRAIAVTDITVNTDTGDATGSIKIKRTGKRISIIGNTDINNFDFDRFHYVQSNNTQPMQWLRSSGHNVAFKLHVTNAIMRSNKLSNLSCDASMNAGEMRLNSLVIQSEDKRTDLNGTILISSTFQSELPFFSAIINGKSYDTNLLGLFTPIETYFARGEYIDKVMWSSNPFNFSKLEKYNGELKIELQNVLFKEGVIKDFIFEGNVKNRLLSAKKLSGTTRNGGAFVLSGNLSMIDEASLWAVFSASNLPIENIIRSLGMKAVAGSLSVSGSIKTQGKSFMDWAKGLHGKLNYALRNIDVAGIDLNNLIIKLFLSKNKSDIVELTQMSLYEGDTSFAKIDGTADISHGIATSQSDFLINSASGALSANFSIPQLIVLSVFRFFFIPPNLNAPVHMDMTLQGPVWQPKITFNTDALYAIVHPK